MYRRACGRAARFVLRAAAIGLVLASGLQSTSCDGGGTGGVKRIVILTNGTSPFWDAAKIGAQDAAKDLDVAASGLRVVVDTNDFSDEGQITKLREYRGMTDIAGVGISVTNSGNATIADEMRLLGKQGVNVITIDSDVDRKQDRDARIAYLGTDNVYGGRELGKAARALRPQGAKYATFVGLKGAANAQERIRGFAEGAGEGFVHVETYTDGGDQNKARKNVRDAIDRNPDLNMLVGIWSYNGPAIVDVIKQLGRRKDFAILIFDAEPVAIDYMEQGFIDAMAVQNPYAMGYEGVRLLKALYEKDEATIQEMRRRMNRTGEEDIFDTGLKIIIPDGDTPLADVQFGEATQKMRLSEFKAWLKEKGLTGS